MVGTAAGAAGNAFTVIIVGVDVSEHPIEFTADTV